MKRQRSATESLVSIALMLEAFLVFFAALAAYALEVIGPVAALAGGAAFIVVLVACARLARFPAAVAVGWVLQGALVATGILLPLMYFIGVGFLALFAYCFIKGRSLDRISTSSITDKDKK